MKASTRMTLAACAVAAVCAALDARTATAQDLERGQFVRDRARPELDPLGIRLGSFLLFPRLTTGIAFNDNVFAEADDEESDFVAEFRPGFDLRSNFNRHELRLTGEAEIARYFDFTDENYVDFSIAASGRYDIGARGAARASVFRLRDHEDRGDPDTLDAFDEPVVVRTTGGSAGFEQGFGRFTASIGGTVRQVDFEDVDIAGGGTANQDDRDRLVTDITSSLSYEIQPGYAAFVRGTYTIVDFDDDEDDAGFNRDSQGYEVVGGARFDLTGLIVGEVFAGYLQRDYDDDDLTDFDGIAFGGRLDWALTQLTTLYGEARREVVETTVDNATSIDRQAFTLGVDHELLRQLLLEGQFRYIRDDFDGSDLEENRYRVLIGGTYSFNRNLFLNASYTFETRTSDDEDREFDRNLVLLRLGARL